MPCTCWTSAPPARSYVSPPPPCRPPRVWPPSTPKPRSRSIAWSWNAYSTRSPVSESRSGSSPGRTPPRNPSTSISTPPPPRSPSDPPPTALVLWSDHQDERAGHAAARPGPGRPDAVRRTGRLRLGTTTVYPAGRRRIQRGPSPPFHRPQSPPSRHVHCDGSPPVPVGLPVPRLQLPCHLLRGPAGAGVVPDDEDVLG